jgi:hypothetical protein
MTKEALKEYKFWVVNRRSNTSFQVTIKGTDYYDAKEKARKKFPYPIYKFEGE